MKRAAFIAAIVLSLYTTFAYAEGYLRIEANEVTTSRDQLQQFLQGRARSRDSSLRRREWRIAHLLRDQESGNRPA